MKVNLHAVNFTIDKKLETFTEEKLSKLEKYFDKIITADVFMRVEQMSEKENKTVEVKLLVPGDEFVVKKTFKTFEEGVDTAIESLERSLVKYKEKQKQYL